MATLTISTDGRLGEREVHKVETLSATRAYFGTSLGGGTRTTRDAAVIALDIEQALGVAYDLLYQAVDAGAIEGFSVQHPAA